MVKLCIFDLDGTVLDTLGTISYYANGALEKNGVAPIEQEVYKTLVGTGIKNLVRNMLNFRDCYTEELFERVFADYDSAYNADVAFGTRIYDGLHEVLDAIKAQGIRMAIVSNKPDYAAQEVVAKLYGENYFDFVTGQKPGGVLKPDPTVVLSVMKDMGVSPEECIYVGDTSTDMKTGKNAKIFTVGVLWGFRGREELEQNGADLLAETPQQLGEFVFERIANG